MITLERFQALAAAGFNRIPLFITQLADTLTPLSVYARLQDAPLRYLFESVQGGERWARYSMIGLGDGLIAECRDGRLRLQLALDQAVTETETADPLVQIQALLADERIPTAAELPGLPGFLGGLVGYFGYDCIRYIEPRLGPCQLPDPVGMPDIWLMRSTTVIVFDNLRDTCSLIVMAQTSTATDPDRQTQDNQAIYQAGLAQLVSLQQQVQQTVSLTAVPFTPPSFESQTGQAAFEQTVRRVQDYILDGDVMQVVPSQRMSSPFDGDALSVYRALRHLNPSPYLFLVQGRTLDQGLPFHLVGSSPEILSRLEQGKVSVRPIAGTRRRGATPEEDQALEQELLADGKEIAEHLMLIDLGRNDVGRVSQVGQVRVTERMTIERYSHVMHIVSHVEGQIRPELDAMAVFRATFPAGTLTGAPKIRAMEIIDELEPLRRGVFGGAVGYLGWHGEMDTAIAIRTGVIYRGYIHVQAGAGVVADSVPASEWQETLIKARAVMAAVEMAAGGLDLSPTV